MSTVYKQALKQQGSLANKEIKVIKRNHRKNTHLIQKQERGKEHRIEA